MKEFKILINKYRQKGLKQVGRIKPKKFFVRDSIGSNKENF